MTNRGKATDSHVPAERNGCILCMSQCKTEVRTNKAFIMHREEQKTVDETILPVSRVVRLIC